MKGGAVTTEKSGISKSYCEVAIHRRESAKLEGKKSELLRIAEAAVQHSGGRLCFSLNEKDKSSWFVDYDTRFIKLDGKRLGRDIELYGFIGDGLADWQQALIMFLEEIVLPLKRELPESYAKASEMIRALGEEVYPESTIEQWRKLFYGCVK